MRTAISETGRSDLLTAAQPGGGVPGLTANTMNSVNTSPSTWSPKHPGPSVVSHPNQALQKEVGATAPKYKPPPVVWSAGTTATPVSSTGDRLTGHGRSARDFPRSLSDRRATCPTSLLQWP